MKTFALLLVKGKKNKNSRAKDLLPRRKNEWKPSGAPIVLNFGCWTPQGKKTTWVKKSESQDCMTSSEPVLHTSRLGLDFRRGRKSLPWEIITHADCRSTQVPAVRLPQSLSSYQLCCVWALPGAKGSSSSKSYQIMNKYNNNKLVFAQWILYLCQLCIRTLLVHVLLLCNVQSNSVLHYYSEPSFNCL